MPSTCVICSHDFKSTERKVRKCVSCGAPTHFNCVPGFSASQATTSRWQTIVAFQCQECWLASTVPVVTDSPEGLVSSDSEPADNSAADFAAVAVPVQCLAFHENFAKAAAVEAAAVHAVAAPVQASPVQAAARATAVHAATIKAAAAYTAAVEAAAAHTALTRAAAAAYVVPTMAHQE